MSEEPGSQGDQRGNPEIADTSDRATTPVNDRGIEQRRWAIAALVYLVSALVLAGGGLLPHRVSLPLDLVRDLGAWKSDPQTRVAISNKILSDPVLEYAAWDEAIRRHLRRGELPWRNPLAGDGAQLFANPETALLFPPTWLRYAAGQRGWCLLLLVKLVVGGLGMWWLARVLVGADWRFALASGFVYQTCGYMTVWLLFPHTNVLAMLPWLAATVVRALASPTRGRLAAVIGTAALATAGGHPETLFHGVVAVGVFLSIIRRGERWSGSAILRTALAAFLGFAILATSLVPFLVALERSQIRQSRGAERDDSTHWFNVPAQILPGYLGSPLEGEIDLSGIRQPGAANFNERNGGFTGLVTLLLIAAAWKKLDRRVRIGLAIGLVCLVVSWNPPVVRDVLGALPLVSVAANGRLSFVFAFFAAIAIAPSLHGIGAEIRLPRLANAMLAAGALLVIVGLAPVLPLTRPALESAARSGISALRERAYLRLPAAVYEERLTGYLVGIGRVAVRWIGVPGLALLAGGAALRMRRRRLLVLGGAMAVEMVGFAIAYNPAVDTRTLPATPPAIRAIQAADPNRQFLLAAAAGIYPSNLATFDGVRDVRAYDVLQTHERIGHLTALGYDPRFDAFPDEPPAAQRGALAKEGVRFYLSRHAVPDTARIGGAAPPAVGVYELPGARPQPPGANEPPDGLGPGVAITLGASLAAFVLLGRAGRRA